MTFRLAAIAMILFSMAGCLSSDRIATDAHSRAFEGQQRLEERLAELEKWRDDTIAPELADQEQRITSLEKRSDDADSTHATMDYVDAQITRTEEYCDDAIGKLDIDLTTVITDLDNSIPDWILEDTTWTVDGMGGTDTTFATPEDAVDAAQRVRIAPNAVLTLNVKDGNYTMTAPLEVRHPDGAQLEIVGNTGDPSNVELMFNGMSGILVQDGYSLGLLDGVTLKGGKTGTGDGVRVDAGFARIGHQVFIQEFGGNGVLAMNNGVVIGDRITVEKAGGDGIRAERGAHFGGEEVSVTLSGKDGVVAHSGGTVYAPGLTSHENRIGAFANGGMTYVQGSSFQKNLNGGVALFAGGSMLASNSVFNDNGGYGASVEASSAFHCSDCAFSENKAYGLLVQSASGAYVARAVYSSNTSGGTLLWGSAATGP